jgi:hypothetical protein
MPGLDPYVVDQLAPKNSYLGAVLISRAVNRQSKKETS